VKLKVDVTLSKRLRLRVALRLGVDEGAALDVRARLGGAPLRWKAALAPGRKAERELARNAERDRLPGPAEPLVVPERKTNEG
jgi:hypothetical protein